MPTKSVRHEDLKAGDIIELFGVERRVLRIEPYYGRLQGCIGIAKYTPGPTTAMSLWEGQWIDVLNVMHDDCDNRGGACEECRQIR
jgi:hypothetical protein